MTYRFTEKDKQTLKNLMNDGLNSKQISILTELPFSGINRYYTMFRRGCSKPVEYLNGTARKRGFEDFRDRSNFCMHMRGFDSLSGQFLYWDKQRGFNSNNERALYNLKKLGFSSMKECQLAIAIEKGHPSVYEYYKAGRRLLNQQPHRILFRKYLKKRIVELRMTRKELAEAMGISYDSLRSYMDGYNHPRRPVLKKILLFLGAADSDLGRFENPLSRAKNLEECCQHKSAQ